MKIDIVRDEVKSLDIDHLKALSLNPNDWQAAGVSEYRLYAYLSTFFNKTTILDIGTRTGGSALALSYNPQNTVRSYDLVEQGASTIKKIIFHSSLVILWRMMILIGIMFLLS